MYQVPDCKAHHPSRFFFDFFVLYTKFFDIDFTLSFKKGKLMHLKYLIWYYFCISIKLNQSHVQLSIVFNKILWEGRWRLIKLLMYSNLNIENHNSLVLAPLNLFKMSLKLKRLFSFPMVIGKSKKLNQFKIRIYMTSSKKSTKIIGLFWQKLIKI